MVGLGRAGSPRDGSSAVAALESTRRAQVIETFFLENGAPRPARTAEWAALPRLLCRLDVFRHGPFLERASDHARLLDETYCDPERGPSMSAIIPLGDCSASWRIERASTGRSTPGHGASCHRQ